MKCSKNAVSYVTSKTLGHLGRIVGQHPSTFILLPLMVTLVLSTGIQNLRYVDDAEFLFSPKDGLSKKERATVDHHFPINQSGGFSASRLTHLCRVGRALVVARDGGTVLRQEIFEELVQLDLLVQNISITMDNRVYQYRDMCAHWQGECVENGILALNNYMDKIASGARTLQYPVVFDTDTFKLIVLPAHLGGMSKHENNTITEAKAVSLGYFVAGDTPAEDQRGRLWEDEFLRVVSKASFEHINVSYFSSDTLQNELDQNLRDGTPYVTISLILMLVFSAISCMSMDCVRSKAWLGMTGVFCTTLGILASYGFLIYCGVEFTGINFTVPFLALGIGLDDTFVLISCWRQTSPSLPVPTRLQQTLEKAGISITITSATDFLSFWIGVITPFEAIRIFCIYIATSILFVYLVHITMFAACMAYSGYLEEDSRHGLLCFKILPKSQAHDKNAFYRLFCTGGDSRNELKPYVEPPWTIEKFCDSHNSSSLPKPPKTTLVPEACCSFLSDILTKALNVFWIKIGILLAFACYLAIAIWGIHNLSEGLDVQNLCRYKSQAAHFYDLESRYFQQYRVQIVTVGKYNYSDPAFQEDVEKMLSSFENKDYMGGKLLTESWLRSFLSYVKYTDLKIENEMQFIQEVKRFIKGSFFELDVKFSEDGMSIEASRFLAQTKDVSDGDRGTAMMMDLRAEAEKFPFNVTVFNPYFLYFDQFTLVRPYTIQCVVVAAAVMMTVAVMFLPDIACAICIALAILSIEVGVVGFMAIWGIKLDAIAMINLIMCIGFSVDFSAHIVHAFLSAPCSSDKSPIQQMRHAFQMAGMPILQGAISTILSILPLLLVPSYIAMAFFKIIFLVTVLGGVHALFLLPVLLSFVQSKSCKTASCTESMSEPPKCTAENDASSGLGHQNPNSSSHSGEIAVHVDNDSPITIKITQMIKDYLEEDTGIGTSADDCSDSSLSTPRVEVKTCKLAVSGDGGNSEMKVQIGRFDKATQTIKDKYLNLAVEDCFRGGYDTDVDDDDYDNSE